MLIGCQLLLARLSDSRSAGSDPYCGIRGLSTWDVSFQTGNLLIIKGELHERSIPGEQAAGDLTSAGVLYRPGHSTRFSGRRCDRAGGFISELKVNCVNEMNLSAHMGKIVIVEQDKSSFTEMHGQMRKILHFSHVKERNDNLCSSIC